MMRQIVTIAVMLGLVSLLMACQGGGNLPADKAQAVQEGKEALRSWIKLLNEGKGTEFLRAALPDSMLKDPEIATADGAFTPAFLEKFYRVLPQLHIAMQEALQVEPKIEKGNLVFLFAAESSSKDLFKDNRIYLSKTGQKWHFNGPVAEKYAAQKKTAGASGTSGAAGEIVGR